ncbi:MAG TPA: 4-alpha-glucanotransferase [Deltaproteobacteria bacterium]|nr:MAG: 4-alpha-glucanotransferase [Deltaproteobacteria bacterium GWC2_65_14]HBO70745.1 4-alpha-glucanotransferase [Deltaproteobacteria bacterium]
MSGPSPGGVGGVRRLAHACGVQTAYHDILRRRVEVGPETLLAVLRALGSPVETAADVPGALRERDRARWTRICDPVTVAWEGERAKLGLRLPERAGSRKVRIRIRLEEGGTRDLPFDLSRIPGREGALLDGVRFVEKAVPLPRDLPRGYHALTVESGKARAEALLFAAPRRAWPPGRKNGEKAWGVFLPLYAVRSERNGGSGDLTDLEALLEWTGAQGGGVVGTLPLLASFLSEPFHPSPYTPASRLFWNEFYLDVPRIPGFVDCEEAQAIAGSGPFREEERRLREAPLVDYRRGMAHKRRLLETLSDAFFARGGERGSVFRTFLSENPDAKDYAAFRAAGDALRTPWAVWPRPLRDGSVSPKDYRERDRRYHLFAQFAFQEQFREITRGASARGRSLYLDLPLGVAYDSYDVWRHRKLFAREVSAGAPPDDFFTRGQDWGFPPMHPERIREEGYRYYRACLRHQLRHAGILRIDHVMGFHRFFWVPRGMEAREGTYVRYRAEEFYAILALESHRHKARIVGEDLGTVPSYVRPAMARRGIRRMFVVQFGMSPDPGMALRRVPADSLACVNTHDMPTFASFWEGGDVAEREALGLLDGKGRKKEEVRRLALRKSLAAFLRGKGLLAGSGPDAMEVLSACLAYLAKGAAGTVVVNLEDLWQEVEPQNMPGTWKERPNWMRKARHSQEEFGEMPGVTGSLREVDRLRRGGNPSGGGGNARNQNTGETLCDTT